MTDTTDARLWCWRFPYADRCEGPFDTRDAAICNARHGHNARGRIEVGRCTLPLDAVGMADADDLCNVLNDRFEDEGLEATASIENFEEANAALWEWARKYLTVEGPLWVIADAEVVEEDA